jgi:hypothetical protein
MWNRVNNVDPNGLDLEQMFQRRPERFSAPPPGEEWDCVLDVEKLDVEGHGQHLDWKLSDDTGLKVHDGPTTFNSEQLGAIGIARYRMGVHILDETFFASIQGFLSPEYWVVKECTSTPPPHIA